MPTACRGAFFCPVSIVLTEPAGLTYGPANSRAAFTKGPPCLVFSRMDGFAMKIKNSLRSLRARHRNCRVVRRRGRLYVINKTNRRFKARQG